MSTQPAQPSPSGGQVDFNQVEFERIDLAANARRYYLIAWQPNLYGEGTLIRWPTIRVTIKTRLRHGYRFLA